MRTIVYHKFTNFSTLYERNISKIPKMRAIGNFYGSSIKSCQYFLGINCI